MDIIYHFPTFETFEKIQFPTYFGPLSNICKYPEQKLQMDALDLSFGMSQN